VVASNTTSNVVLKRHKNFIINLQVNSQQHTGCVYIVLLAILQASAGQI
jgi:hypothetical protein